MQTVTITWPISRCASRSKRNYGQVYGICYWQQSL